MVFLPNMDFTQQGEVRTRFAPSPNGALHLGHAFSALCAHDFARACGGAFYLRIEDIDGTRSRTEHIDAILADMAWLGLVPDGAVQYQSANVARYAEAFEKLKALGLLYRCSCTRGDIAAALKLARSRTALTGRIIPVLAATGISATDVPHSWRIDMAKAAALAGPLRWTDLAAGEQLADPMLFGDVVLWRKDAPASYHLAATVDDAADGISHVVRGRDLFAYTAIHRLLQDIARFARAGLLASSVVARHNGRETCQKQIVAGFGGADAWRAKTVTHLLKICVKGRFRLEFRCLTPR